jgi:TetR/AcrR family transcriptional repressor of bet genes
VVIMTLVNLAAGGPRAPRRTAPPEQRREQLIDATIRCVANRGLADTTIATVAREAGLSQGIINLHFQTKDGCCTRRCATWPTSTGTPSANGDKAGDSPEAGLTALVDLDFQRTICERSKLAVWFAFWGERRFRPTYRRICAERDRPMTTWCARSAPDSARAWDTRTSIPTSSPTACRR